MTKKINYLAFLGLSIFVMTFFSSCEKVSPPYKEAYIPPVDTSTGSVQRVLIEDFTGARCGNCPKAHDKISELKDLYPGKIVAIAIHAGGFAVPFLPPYTMYRTDFRTSVGRDLDAFFHPDYPSGLINREKVGVVWVQPWANWASIIDTLVKRKPKLDIKVDCYYDTSYRDLHAVIEVNVLSDISANLKLCAFLTEDSIITWQTDYRHTPPDVPNYVHKHVLRSSFTPSDSTWGENISTGLVHAGKLINKQYEIDLDHAWNPHHCSAIVYVYDDLTKEILQVTEQDKFYILLKK